MTVEKAKKVQELKHASSKKLGLFQTSRCKGGTRVDNISPKFPKPHTKFRRREKKKGPDLETLAEEKEEKKWSIWSY